MPIVKAIKHIKMAGKFKKVSLIALKDSGIRSVSDTVIITPAAKLSEALMILVVLFFIINIIIVPSKVENPAKKVNKKLYNKLSMLLTYYHGMQKHNILIRLLNNFKKKNYN